MIRTLQRLLASECAALCLLVLIGSAHRAYIFWRYSGPVVELIRQNPDWLTWQFLPVRAYRDHFLSSMWYLQQTPPLPHVVFKLVLSLFSWPLGVGRCLCLMQGAITIATSLLLFGIIARVCRSRLAAIVLAAVFLMSTDALVLEYNSFGQTFYENLAMLLVTATCRLFMIYVDSSTLPNRAVSVAGSMGALAALAALDRASFAYFAVALLPFILFRPRLRNLAAFVLPILLLHGSWVLKNAIVYGNVSVATSSWAGLNATASLMRFGEADSVVKYILDHREGYPPWFTKMLAEVGYVHWGPTFRDYEPLDVKQEEDRIQDALGGTNPHTNFIGQRLISDYYFDAMKGFVLAQPRLMARKFRAAYRLTWQRIGNYGAMFLDPLYVEPVDRALFDLSGRFAREQQYTMTGHWDATRSGRGRGPGHPAHFWTLNLAAVDAASILLLHLVLPFVLLADLVQRLTRRRASTRIEVYFLVATFAYSVIVFDNAEFGENNRFRLAIEPVIIALTAYCGAVVLRISRDLARRSCGRSGSERAARVASKLAAVLPRAGEGGRHRAVDTTGSKATRPGPTVMTLERLAKALDMEVGNFFPPRRTQRGTKGQHEDRCVRQSGCVLEGQRARFAGLRPADRQAARPRARAARRARRLVGSGGPALRAPSPRASRGQGAGAGWSTA